MVRRVVMIGAGAGLVLSVLAWGASMLTVTWRNPRTLTGVFGLWSGMVVVSNGGSYTGPGWRIGPGQLVLHWWPQESRFFDGYGSGRWRLLVPIWMPSVGFGGVYFAAWWLRKRRRPGCCEWCGYDLRGGGGVCPECGRSAEVRG